MNFYTIDNTMTFFQLCPAKLSTARKNIYRKLWWKAQKNYDYTESHGDGITQHNRYHIQSDCFASSNPTNSYFEPQKLRQFFDIQQPIVMGSEWTVYYAYDNLQWWVH